MTNLNGQNTIQPEKKQIKMRKIKDFGDGNKTAHMIMLVSSIFLGLLLWYAFSRINKVASILSTPEAVWNITLERIRGGYFLDDVMASLRRVLTGYAFGMLCAIPMGFLMGWYKVIRNLSNAWLQFFRTIPPIATIPIMVVAFGTGEESKIAIIFVAVFLSSTITIYQGIMETDKTLIRAAYTFGAKDSDLFLYVTLPSAFPYILVAARTALAGSFTTLIAAEMTAATVGLGARIQIASGAARMDMVMMGILTIGVLGFVFDRIILAIEKRLTRWK